VTGPSTVSLPGNQKQYAEQAKQAHPSRGIFASWTRSKLPLVAAFPDLFRNDRERRGFTVGQVAWRLGVKPAEHRRLEAGEQSPDFETWDRICKLHGVAADVLRLM
jgi:ribosome-binding protein aMBF1 (putative translation factor)